jgi:hypothetical protein
LGRPEQLDRKARLVLLDLPAHKEFKAKLVPPDRQVLLATLALPVLRERLVLPVPLARREKREIPDLLGHKERRARRGSRALRDQRALKVKLESREIQDQQGLLAHREKSVLRVLRVKLGQLGRQGPRAYRGPRERLVRLEIPVQLDPRERQVK